MTLWFYNSKINCNSKEEIIKSRKLGALCFPLRATEKFPNGFEKWFPHTVSLHLKNSVVWLGVLHCILHCLHISSSASDFPSCLLAFFSQLSLHLCIYLTSLPHHKVKDTVPFSYDTFWKHYGESWSSLLLLHHVGEGSLLTNCFPMNKEMSGCPEAPVTLSLTQEAMMFSSSPRLIL